MLALTDTQMAQCRRYLDELYLWNDRVNLTSVEKDLAWERHVEESLAVAELVPDGPVRVVDIGSGGGIPGLLLAIARPDATVTLIEADRRKCGFLMHAGGLLGLTNADVVCARAESVATRPECARQFDVATSRAAGPLRQVVEWSVPFVRSGGTVLVMSRDQATLGEKFNGAAVEYRDGILSFVCP
jgi:16S rRNA (guanine527-N7)-methyltransferase